MKLPPPGFYNELFYEGMEESIGLFKKGWSGSWLTSSIHKHSAFKLSAYGDIRLLKNLYTSIMEVDF